MIKKETLEKMPGKAILLTLIILKEKFKTYYTNQTVLNK